MTIRFFASSLVALLSGTVVAPLSADVTMPSIFGNQMILQQDAPLPVWGMAGAGEKVTVTIGKDSASATAAADGKWKVTLEPLAGTSTAQTMTIAGKNTLTFKDVLVGEVWFASGQSNMAFPLGRTKDAATDIPKSDDPLLRIYHVNGPIGLEPTDQLSPGVWAEASPAHVPGVSAVAYYFAKELRAKLNRPVAIVQSAVGGTVAQAWTPLDALQKDPSLKNYVADYDKAAAAAPALEADIAAKTAEWRKEMDQWNKEVGVTYDPLIRAWQAEADKAFMAGQTPPPKPVPSRPQPQPPAHPWGGNNTPTVLYNGLVAPAMPYAIRGVIWYQGESNAGAWAQYHAVLSAMITGWRAHWGQGDFPFLIVQLPRYAKGGSWPQIREAQAQTAAGLPKVYYATVVDVGDPNNLHPIDKADVAQRLALVARHAVYGEKDLVWTGPMYDAMKVEGSAIRLSFTYTGSGLKIASSPWVPPHWTPAPDTSLRGFAIADDQKKWFPAEAKIDGTTVVVSSDQVKTPTAVRYDWQNAPEGNLYNNEGLPAAPFRTDSWSEVGETPPPPPSATMPPPAPAATPPATAGGN